MVKFDAAPTTVPDDYEAGNGEHYAVFYLVWVGLLLFLLFWAWGAIKSGYWQRRPPVSTAPAEGGVVNELTKKQRKQRLVDHFESGQNKLVLTSENFTNVGDDNIESSGAVENNTDDQDHGGDYDVESNEAQRIRIKIPGSEGNDKELFCSQQCAICLDVYKAGDVIVWSSSPDCSHVFHQDCLVDGLARVKNNESPCPCCRAKFCNFAPEAKKAAS